MRLVSLYLIHIWQDSFCPCFFIDLILIKGTFISKGDGFAIRFQTLEVLKRSSVALPILIAILSSELLIKVDTSSYGKFVVSMVKKDKSMASQ